MPHTCKEGVSRRQKLLIDLDQWGWLYEMSLLSTQDEILNS